MYRGNHIWLDWLLNLGRANYSGIITQKWLLFKNNWVRIGNMFHLLELFGSIFI
jgi:hypothetical protein